MTTDERSEGAEEHDAPVEDAVEEDEDQDADQDSEQDGDGGEGETGEAPDWWHRDHPVFTPLSGFFTGLVTVIVLPGLYAALLSTLFDDDTAGGLFPFVAVLLVVPIVLITVPRSRRFGRYMLAGMLVTAVVVVAVGALTLWVLVQLEG